MTAPATTAPDPDDLDGERHFSSVRAFGRSKAADLMFTYELARRVQDLGISVCAYHPGVTRTPLMKGAPPLMRGIGAVMNLTAQTPEQAAKGLIDPALSPELEGMTGQLIHDGKPIKAPFIDDSEAHERLWSASERLVGIRSPSRASGPRGEQVYPRTISPLFNRLGFQKDAATRNDDREDGTDEAACLCSSLRCVLTCPVVRRPARRCRPTAAGRARPRGAPRALAGLKRRPAYGGRRSVKTAM